MGSIPTDEHDARPGPSDPLDRTRLAAARVHDELERTAEDLSRPWPSVPADVLADGRARVAAAIVAVEQLLEKVNA